VPAVAVGDGGGPPAGASQQLTLVGSTHALWHFDETSGTVAADSSGNGNDGTIVGDVSRGEPGYLGTAFGFGADGSWVRVPTSSSLNPGTSDFSYSARVKLDRLPASGQTMDVIRKGLSGTKAGEFKIEILDLGRVRCIAKDSNRVRGAITGSAKMRLAVGQWYLVGCEQTGSSWSVIVNDLKRSTTVNFGSISNSLALSIGSNYGEEDFVDGVVDEVELSIE
jgi:hypothetical protein